MHRYLSFLFALLLILSCGEKELKYWERIELSEGLSQAHILDIACKGDEVFVCTYSDGAFFSKDNGQTWRQFKADTGDSSGLSADYIISGDWDDDYIILATLCDGLNVSDDGGDTWQRLGNDFLCGKSALPVSVIIDDESTYIPSSDGIIHFKDKITPDMEYSEDIFKTIDKGQGLASEYIYDLVIRDNMFFAGTLHGFSYSVDKGSNWINCSPTGSYTDEGAPDCKVKTVAANEKYWYAGCDNGLFYSDDKGQHWVNISRGLPSVYIHDILIDRKGKLWVATYKGIAFTDNDGQSYKTFGKTSGFYGDNINCLAQSGDGNIFAGTNYGLYRMKEKIPAPNNYPTVQAEFGKLEKPAHQWLIRPVSPNVNNYLDQTNLFSSIICGSSAKNQGCLYNNSEGVKALAVDYGTIVYTNRKIGHVVLKCDTRYKNYYVYAHYHHLKKVARWIGQRVSKYDIIGLVGRKGKAVRECLYFEVSLSKMDDSNVPNEPVNPELWQKPLPGCGTIAGIIADTAGNFINDVKIFGVEKPAPAETPFSYAKSYHSLAYSSPAYKENFVIGDVPAGDYLLWAVYDGEKYAIKAKVASLKVAQVKIIIGQ
ncbi:MAG: peptidoglycan DD-metalloendopeptidase family protein [candidate division Zixibacteria bacterium]|nr:peptidoglycan DD-metalloendopeptidase family protein [candidate division Zixibacteria bacterium]